jgi:enhancing lycopene biosynthesis protein 2
MKQIAIILSGCGYKDGSEITESVSTLIALSEIGASYKMFALNKNFPSTNHKSGASEDQRNTLTESARIARGDIQDLRELNEENFDALILPGGYGAALHLCNWAEKGADCDVDKDVARILNDFHSAGKPIAGICIAPALLAKVFGSSGLSLTIGNDKSTAKEIQKTGANHVDCAVTDFVSDRKNKIVTTPAYMYEAKAFEVYTGIRKAIHELVEMA